MTNVVPPLLQLAIKLQGRTDHFCSGTNCLTCAARKAEEVSAARPARPDWDTRELEARREEPVQPPSEPGRLSTAAQAKAFIFAGNATFTLRSRATGVRYTYKVRQADTQPGRPATYFVSLLAGPDNENDFQYLGVAREGLFQLTRKSRMLATAAPVQAISFALLKLKQNALLNKMEIWHEGRCGRCGRKLTVPESIAAGLGPECAGKVA